MLLEIFKYSQEMTFTVAFSIYRFNHCVVTFVWWKLPTLGKAVVDVLLTRKMHNITHNIWHFYGQEAQIMIGLYIYRSPKPFYCVVCFFIWQWLISTRKSKVRCCISEARLDMPSQTDTVSHSVHAACFLNMSHQISFRPWKTLHTLAKLTFQTILLNHKWSFHVHTFTAHPQGCIPQSISSVYCKFETLNELYIATYNIQKTKKYWDMSCYGKLGAVWDFQSIKR